MLYDAAAADDDDDDNQCRVKYIMIPKTSTMYRINRMDPGQLTESCGMSNKIVTILDNYHAKCVVSCLSEMTAASQSLCHQVHR